MSDLPAAHAPADDVLTRFLLPTAGVRGVHVRLGASWREIASRDAYPPAVATMLGDSVAAAAMFAGHAKVDGRLSIQLRAEGALRTLFAECTADGTLRGIAQLDLARGEAPTDLAGLGRDAVLAITVENPGIHGGEPMRYQGLVSLEAPDLARALEDYFARSEQLPTRVLLACGDERASGLMLQKLPGDGGDQDGWRRASALFDTLSTAELAAWSPDQVLQRLFHEDAPEVLARRELRFGCSCSGARVAAMLESLGEDEAVAAVIDGAVRIRCEFCGQSYAFDRAAIDALFTPARRPMAAPDRVQ